MKQNISMKKSKIIILISLALIMFLAIDSYAQPQPPGHDATGNVPGGGGAPIGGGLLILIGMGVAYGAKKIFQLRKENIQD